MTRQIKEPSIIEIKTIFEKEVSALEKLDVASTASKNELLFK